jgi:hypothetical protein
MTVMEMLGTATDLSEVRIRIFDCNSEEIIFDSDKLKDEDPVMEIYMSDMADYEVSSFDLYLHNGVINLELNIDYEPEEDDD